MVTPEQQNWVAKLLGYDYKIIYYPSRENSATNALSHKPGSPILHYLYLPQVSLWEKIKKPSKKDAYISQVGRLKAHTNGVMGWIYIKLELLFLEDQRSEKNC